MDENNKKSTGRIKRILKAILLAVLLVVLLLALIGLWSWKEKSDYESTAVPYLQSVVPEIVTWDPDIAWKYFDDEIRNSISRKDNDKIIRYLSMLGKLESMGRPQFLQVTSSASLSSGTRKLVVYQIPAVFENGDATIKVTLIDRDGKFGIQSFHVSSMAFAEPTSAEPPGDTDPDATSE